jgi:hypothetical protein
LKTGTGGTCGSSVAVIWSALGAANVAIVDNMTTPLKVPANSEICWIVSGAGSKTLRINGYIGPS